MTKKSDEFEMLNKRVEDLVHGAGAVVEWNAKIPDPDSRSDSRQIDVLITANDGRRISVEFRDRGGAQSVMWIEELAGRKQSLQLNGMIAVSTKGFSQLAAIKAARFGIVLYDFAALSDEEIASWADMTEVRRSWRCAGRGSSCGPSLRHRPARRTCAGHGQSSPPRARDWGRVLRDRDRCNRHRHRLAGCRTMRRDGSADARRVGHASSGTARPADRTRQRDDHRARKPIIGPYWSCPSP